MEAIMQLSRQQYLLCALLMLLALRQTVASQNSEQLPSSNGRILRSVQQLQEGMPAPDRVLQEQNLEMQVLGRLGTVGQAQQPQSASQPQTEPQPQQQGQQATGLPAQPATDTSAANTVSHTPPAPISNVTPHKIGILTVAVKSDHRLGGPMDQFTLLSLANKAKYCYLQGYELLPVFWNKLINQHHPSWLKIPALKHYLNQGVHDWIWSLDLDAFVMNMTLTIQDHVLANMTNTNASLIIAKDCNGINGGSFFIRPTPWAKRFLDEVWALRHRMDVVNIRWWWEQAAMMHLFKNWPAEEIEKNVEFISPKRINAYINNCGAHFEGGDFVLHLAGVQPKLETIRQYEQYLNVR